MILAEDGARDLAALVVEPRGSLRATGDPWEPWQLLDPAGSAVAPVTAYLRDLQAGGRSSSTQRSYAMDLLRWFRFLWAAEVVWDQATRIEARDFSRWVQLADKPTRSRGRRRDQAGSPSSTVSASAGAAVNPVTGKASPGTKYAPATRAHSESVLRGFYDFHGEAGTGPMVNPFPLARPRLRAHAHHNPMEPHRNERAGLYRPRLVPRVPRAIPEDRFNELFARLPSNRDRALVAFWVSTGARASELLGVTGGDVDPGQQLITVIRKGSRAMQQLPATPDAFVWLRLYQAELHGLVPTGRDQPLWCTLRRPFHRLSYHGAYRMFTRANTTLGANWSLHDLRHTAAYRMARDPQLPLTDVQWVMGHASLTTTQIYLNPLTEDVLASVFAHQARLAGRGGEPAEPAAPALGYRSESLSVLFGMNPT